ncbi:hypothetical protein [Paenibacillus sp. OSY-SE]|uniref:hypothetical protein n=1 Tax=Paenibacillus sp. OSY-SE TaxID=1196323 RepID=UPI0003187252|nr:hypothetical protein [Paenibacillus sp. OSY-SE]
MSVIKLSPFKVEPETNTFIDQFHAVLHAAGLTTYPKYALACMSALAFRFSVHRQLSAVSIFAYDWSAQHYLAADFVGAYSKTYAGYADHPLVPIYRQHVVKEAMHSIDHGVGVVVWQDQFMSLYGYDDDNRLFYAVDSAGKSNQSISFDTLGQGQSPLSFCQLFGAERIAFDIRDLVKESFVQAIYQWEHHDTALCADQFACGERAYDVLIEAFREGEFDWDGAARTIRMYGVFKRYIAQYVQSMQPEMAGLELVASYYAQVCRKYEDINRLLELCLADEPTTMPIRLEIARCFQEAKDAEQAAICQMKQVVHDVRLSRGVTPERR